MDTSNLPPGVTGKEDVFGPQSSRMETQTCEEYGNFRVYAPEVVDVIENYSPTKSVALAQALKMYDSFLAEDVICPFEGKVEVEYWNDYATWHCPLCGFVHRIDYDPWDDE